MQARVATPHDAAAIARIYNQGIEDRMATFETRLRSDQDVRSWFDGVHPVVVVEDDGEMVAFAATFQYRPRECYAGVAECSVYVARDRRGRELRRSSRRPGPTGDSRRRERRFATASASCSGQSECCNAKECRPRTTHAHR